jgi:hypothetical protein
MEGKPTFSGTTKKRRCAHQRGASIGRANDSGLTISDTEVGQILEVLENTHDACIGVTWDPTKFVNPWSACG